MKRFILLFLVLFLYAFLTLSLSRPVFAQYGGGSCVPNGVQYFNNDPSVCCSGFGDGKYCTQNPGGGNGTPAPTPTVACGGNQTIPLQGFVFNDSNKNGVVDANEGTYTGGPNVGFGWGGATVTAVGIGSTTTNAQGYYFLGNVCPGSYTVTLNLPANSFFTFGRTYWNQNGQADNFATNSNSLTVTTNIPVLQNGFIDYGLFPDNFPHLDATSISQKPVAVNGASRYTIRVQASDGDGASDIGSEYALVNLLNGTGNQRPQTEWRGYLGWSTQNFPFWCGSQNCAGPTNAASIIGCSGGGIAAVNTQNTGSQYINLLSCSTSTDGGNIRYVDFTVSFNSNFATAQTLTNNTISGWAEDIRGEIATGWWVYDNFDLAVPIGNFEGTIDAACYAGGWAFDPNTPSTSIPVHVYKYRVGDFPGGPTWSFAGAGTANLPRPDVNAAYASLYPMSGNHGFGIVFDSSSGLLDGNSWNLLIYGIGAYSNALIGGGPKTITCSIPPTPTFTPTPTPTFTPTPTPTPLPTSCQAGGVNLHGNVLIDTLGNNCASGTTGYGGTAKVTTYTSPGGVQTATANTGGGGAYNLNDTTVCGNKTAVLSNLSSNYTVKSARFDSNNPNAFSTSNLSGFSYGPFNFSSDHQLDFCISNITPWIVTDGGDIRLGSLINNVPPGGSSSLNPSAFFSSATNAIIGSGAPPTWIINSEFTYNDDPRNKNGLFSYTFFRNRAKVKQVGTPLLPGCAAASPCTLSATALSNLATGAYLVDGNFTITNVGVYTHSAGSHVLLLVNGDVNIQNNIKVPTGAGNLFVMAARGNINIDPSVGSVSLVSPAAAVSNLDGIYTAEGNITLQSAGNGCANGVTADKQFALGGNFITNALKPFKTGGSGKFVNNRSLCPANDAIYPTFMMQNRYDFVTQLTDFYKIPSVRFKEVNP